ncbi:tripartite tricarboxylate transporter substrate binding protein [Ramlibacter sp. AW1]|uniref:Tripartite tricarboxylate transporter substrate binding protein n=1 Tax=Ramlibacter aurantiacus TaxID=2801330 RepID=A0A936ZNR1_9BURK|nr:tripartite tricarboxylate transporter substrate binding protein [Ramlibacter aurantiacus]MBL0420715.1 tripartite tricarboxylate transporter substrate binding protein [Ramlibacter aurantiacus]
MKRTLASVLATGLVVLGWMAAAPAALAQAYPDKPVRMVMPFGPGGPTDAVARLIAQRLGERLGQPFVVDNRAGANGLIGTEAVARAPADGYTLLVAPTAHAINPSMYKKLPYDTLRDFASVAFIGNSPGLVMVVNNDVPAKSVKELVALARQPGSKVAFGSAGNGNLLHLAGEYFNMKTGTAMLHVPYKSGGQVVQGLFTGEIQVAFLGPPQAAELVKAGKLRALGVTSRERIAQFPDLPTIAETGYPGFELDGGIQAAVYAPAGTPAEVIQKLSREIDEVLKEPAMRARFDAFALTPGGGGPAVLDRQVRTRIDLYGQILRAAKVEPE